MLPMNLAKTASRRPADNASKPCPSAEISSPILAGLGSALGYKGVLLSRRERHDLPKQTMPFKIRSRQKSAKVFIHVNEDGRY